MKNNFQSTTSRNVLPFLLIFLIAVLGFFLNLAVKVPMIQGDEGSYLANAAAIAGYANDLAGSYHSGFSLLISPAFKWGHSPASVWFLVKLINSLLYFVLLLSLWVLGEKLMPGIAMRRKLSSLLATSLYPFAIIYIGFSFSQLALASIYSLSLVLLIYALDRGILTWCALGVLSGYLYWIHPTGLAPVLAAAAISFLISYQRKKKSLFFAYVLSAAVMIILYHELFSPYLQKKMLISRYAADSSYPSIVDMLRPLISVRGIEDVLTRVSGQIFYFTAGTMGLLWLGFFSSINWSKLSRVLDMNAPKLDRYDVFAVFSALSFFGVVLLSVLMLASLDQTLRLDQWMYGRYADAVAMPLIFYGLLQPSFKKIIYLIPLLLFSFCIFELGLGEFNDIAYFNIPSLWQPFLLVKYPIWVWMLFSAIFLIALSRIRREYGVVLILVVFTITTYLQTHWHSKVSGVASNRSVLSQYVRKNFPAGTCVAWDHSGENTTNQRVYLFDLTFALFNYRVTRSNIEEWKQSCYGPFITFRGEDEGKQNNVYSILKSQQGGPYLWIKENTVKHNIYPVSVNRDKFLFFNLLQDGWYDLESDLVWSKERSKIKLTVPEECRNFYCEFLLAVNLYGASENREVGVKFYNNTTNEVLYERTVNFSHIFQVELPVRTYRETETYVIEVNKTTSPRLYENANDDRTLGLALSNVDLKVFK